MYVNGKLFLIKIGLIYDEQVNESKKVNMTSKERGQYIHHMLDTLFVREKHILRMYFGMGYITIGRRETRKKVKQRRTTIEEIGRDFEITTRKVKHIKNRGVRKIRYRLINGGVEFGNDGKGKVLEDQDPYNKLKEYVEGINPDLIHKELPYHYSKSLDEFMLCLIDGVENTI